MADQQDGYSSGARQGGACGRSAGRQSAACNEQGDRCTTSCNRVCLGDVSEAEVVEGQGDDDLAADGHGAGGGQSENGGKSVEGFHFGVSCLACHTVCIVDNTVNRISETSGCSRGVNGDAAAGLRHDVEGSSSLLASSGDGAIGKRQSLIGCCSENVIGDGARQGGACGCIARRE